MTEKALRGETPHMVVMDEMPFYPHTQYTSVDIYFTTETGRSSFTSEGRKYVVHSDADLSSTIATALAEISCIATAKVISIKPNAVGDVLGEVLVSLAESVGRDRYALI